MEYNLAAGINYQGFSYLSPADDGWSSANGIGRIYTDIGDTPSATRAFRRGGNWLSTSFAGVFALYLGNSPAISNSNIGFRCAR
jgi:formylglycine-generating enzyme required for sulfatase activity